MPTISQIVIALMPSSTEIVISLAIIGLGIVFIPALAWLKLVHPKGICGRILWTIGAITFGPYALIQTENGGYELREVHQTNDETVISGTTDDYLRIKEVPENWSRLGKRPFLVSYEKSERLFRDVLSDVSESIPDGGIEGNRGGFRSFNPPTTDGYRVRIHRLLERLREAGGTRLGDIAEEEGLREFAGDSDMSNVVMVGYVLSMVVLGFFGGIWFVS